MPNKIKRLAANGVKFGLKQDDFSSNRHPALASCLRMICSENRFTLFGSSSLSGSSAIQYRRELIGLSEPILHVAQRFRTEDRNNMANTITMSSLRQ
jgi:hypothetical protein